MDAPTLEVPSMRRHPKTGDWYPAMNKPAGVVHWLKHKLGAERGRPVAAYYGYLVRCDNILAKLHTEHPEVCNKVGGLLAMHIDDLRVLAPLWLSKTEEVHEDRAHWETNITGDIYGEGWISEMYGYAFGAAEHTAYNVSFLIEVSLCMGVMELIIYSIVFATLSQTSLSLGRVKAMEPDPNKRRGLFLSIECINTMNEGLLLQHARHGCPMPKWSKYLSFLKSKTFVERTHPKLLTPRTVQTEAVGLMHSFHLSGQPENITSSQLSDYTVGVQSSTWQTVSTPYDYLIGCDNELAKIHTSHPDACDKVGGVIVMHIDDLWAFVLLCEMYGHSFGAAELKLRRRISSEILIYPGYVPQPDVQYRVFHYGLELEL
ncbi:hypothetical protein GOBAR_AA34180 [Gossypium barbadense]|uniref:Hydroxyproline O-arabinosyltransferase-like domain-containing protein n=1 Tax=Gossypium barbadense TaxID=3634 RepID=A0A2P5W5Z0_GOSBA|nr:hypothetical protein GOBAR_AA34180 [Gossypium barbadense]